MRFAILEDDPAQMEVLTGWLREAGHDVHGFGLARELMRVASRESFDLFLVDWVLPDLTGEQVLRWLRVERGNDTPAIFITSRDAEEDIANAFSAGADDYLIKPPRRIELLSRIEAVMRRSQPRTNNQSLVVAPYNFDLARKMLTVDGVPVEMTDKEFELAAFLFRNLGRLLSRGHLLEAVWGDYGTLIGSFVPPTDPWYEDLSQAYPFDQAPSSAIPAEDATNSTAIIAV